MQSDIPEMCSCFIESLAAPSAPKTAKRLIELGIIGNWGGRHAKFSLLFRRHSIWVTESMINLTPELLEYLELFSFRSSNINFTHLTRASSRFTFSRAPSLSLSLLAFHTCNKHQIISLFLWDDRGRNVIQIAECDDVFMPSHDTKLNWNMGDGSN